MMARKRKPQFGVGRNGKPMSPARRAALKKAQAASARKRRGTGKGRPPRAARRNARIDKKISRVKTRGNKRAGKQGAKLAKNLYTNADKTEVYTNSRGVKAYKKGVKITQKTDRKVAKLKSKKKRKRR